MVDAEPSADTWFPEWNPADWLLVSSERHSGDEHNPHSWEIIEWVRQ